MVCLSSIWITVGVIDAFADVPLVTTVVANDVCENQTSVVAAGLENAIRISLDAKTREEEDVVSITLDGKLVSVFLLSHLIIMLLANRETSMIPV